MARYGKTFRTRRGRLGRYKYVRGKRVAFVATNRRGNRSMYKPRGFRTYRRRY